MPGPLAVPASGPAVFQRTAPPHRRVSGRENIFEEAVSRFRSGYCCSHRRRPAAGGASLSGRRRVMIGQVRRNPSTVVVLAGRPGEQVLAAVSRSLNVVLVRPEPPPPARRRGRRGRGRRRRCGGPRASPRRTCSSPPTRSARSPTPGRRCGRSPPRRREATSSSSGRPRRWPPGGPGGSSCPTTTWCSPRRPHRAATTRRRAAGRLLPGAAARGPAQPGVGRGRGLAAAQADALLSELGSLRHGPWWPSLDEVFRTARGFYPGALAESAAAGQASLL